MKNLTTPIVLILILFLFGCESEKLGPQSAPVGPTQQQLIDLRNQGDETGNGGDNITVHFKAEAQQVITILEHFKDKIGVDVDLLKGLFKEGTKRGIVVVSTEQKLYDKFAVLNYDAAGTLESVSGEEKDALNFPNGKSESAYPKISIASEDYGKPLVILNKEAWGRLIEKGADLRLLVFHELAPIVGMTDDSGKMSQQFKNLMRSWDEGQNPDSFEAPVEGLEQYFGEGFEIVQLGDYPEVLDHLHKLNRDLEKSPFDGSSVLGFFQDLFSFASVQKLDQYHHVPVDSQGNLKKSVVYGQLHELADPKHGNAYFRTVVLNLEAFKALNDKEKALQLAIAIMHAQDRFSAAKIEELARSARSLLNGAVLL